jgi:hypothetical protein
MAAYKSPTDAEVREVLRRITTPQLRRAFFEGLKNPLWVAPLAKAGFFTAPPEPETTADGLIRDIYWPEMQYLTRVGPEVPNEVVNVLLPLQTSNNAWFRRGVVAIAGVIPPEDAVRLQPLLREWATSGFGWRTDPRDLVRVAVRLLQGGQKKQGRWFANVIFRPNASENRSRPSDVLEEYSYEQGLPELVAALGDDGLSLVWPWLELYQRQVGHLTENSDMTYMSRDSIRTRGESYDGVEQALIDAVRDLAIRAMAVDPARAVVLLSRPAMILGRKIALFALSEAIRQPTDDAESAAAMQVAAERLLFDEESFNDSCRIEYAELARAVSLVIPDLPGWLSEIFGDGPRIEEDRLRGRLARDDDAEGAVEERVAEHKALRLHRWLSSIGADALPDQLRHELQALDERFGVMDSPLEPTSRINPWSGLNSPITIDEMSVMSPTELAVHLESWHSTAQRVGPEPSHEGQARELTTLLTSNPQAIAGVEDLVDRLRPTYLRAILGGWEAALKAGLDLDWDAAVELVGDVLAHGDESAFPHEGNEFDDDVDFRGAKHAAVGLLEEVVKDGGGVTIPEGAMARFADLLIASADDEKAWSDYSSETRESGMDPLTLSLNWQWPMRVRGLVHLMARDREAAWYERARAALERELARDDTRGASRAVLGEMLGRLLNIDKNWAEQNISNWFGTAAGTTTDQQIALSTAIAVHHYHRMLYDLLSGPMLAVLAAHEPIAVGWNSHRSVPVQRIGEWVIEAIIRGDKDIDDPIARAFFSTVSAKERGEAIAHIAWTFMHAERVDDDIRDRFAALWDERVDHVRNHPEDREELNGFFWFVRSKKFQTEWWLPRLKEAAALDPHLAGERYMLGKGIASAADVDPRTAFDIVTLLLDSHEGPAVAVHELTRNALPMVLARAIDSSDEALSAEATQYMNQLGEQGRLGLEGEVKAVLEGAVTQTDVEG